MGAFEMHIAIDVYRKAMDRILGGGAAIGHSSEMMCMCKKISAN